MTETQSQQITELNLAFNYLEPRLHLPDDPKCSSCGNKIEEMSTAGSLRLGTYSMNAIRFHTEEAMDKNWNKRLRPKDNFILCSKCILRLDLKQ